MVGLCSGDRDLPPLRPGALLATKQELGCSVKSRVMVSWGPGWIPGGWVPGVHSNCMHNERASLLLRTLGPTPNPDVCERGPVRSAFGLLRGVCRKYSGETWDLDRTALSYEGALRRRYIEARDSLRVDPMLSKKDVQLSAFLKAEKINSMSKYPKPRMIFPRSPRYNLLLASWLKPFEHWLWGNLKSFRFFNVPKSRLSAKGLNGDERARLIARKMDNFYNPIVLEVDGKAFEAHCDKWLLQLEHSLYLAAFRQDPELQSLLNYQLKLKGHTALGYKFERRGGRASGDFNTGMGNTLIMLAVTIAAMRELEFPKFDLLADGDNCLLFVEDSHRGLLDNFYDTVLRTSGHEFTLEKPVSVLEKVRFGQCAPVHTAAGLRMVRNPLKVISQCAASHQHMHNREYRAKWAAGVGYCEQHLNAGVPVLSAYASYVRSLSEKTADWDKYRDYQYLGVPRDRAPPTVPITNFARESFAEAFGMSVEVQERLEEIFKQGVPSGDVIRSEPTTCEDVEMWQRDPDASGGWWDPLAVAEL